MGLHKNGLMGNDLSQKGAQLIEHLLNLVFTQHIVFYDFYNTD